MKHTTLRTVGSGTCTDSSDRKTLHIVAGVERAHWVCHKRFVTKAAKHHFVTHPGSAKAGHVCGPQAYLGEQERPGRGRRRLLGSSHWALGGRVGLEDALRGGRCRGRDLGAVRPAQRAQVGDWPQHALRRGRRQAVQGGKEGGWGRHPWQCGRGEVERAGTGAGQEKPPRAARSPARYATFASTRVGPG